MGIDEIYEKFKWQHFMRMDKIGEILWKLIQVVKN